MTAKSVDVCWAVRNMPEYPGQAQKMHLSISGARWVPSPGVLWVNHVVRSEGMAVSIHTAAEALQQKNNYSSNKVHCHEIEFAEKVQHYHQLLRELVWWVLRDGSCLWNTEARGGMFLGPGLVIFHHHPRVTKHQLNHGNWLLVSAACLLQMCEKLCSLWPSFIPLWILLSTLTTGYIHKLGWLSWLRWCRIMTGLRQLTPQCGWSLRHFSLAFSWEGLSLPVFVYPLSTHGASGIP